MGYTDRSFLRQRVHGESGCASAYGTAVISGVKCGMHLGLESSANSACVRVGSSCGRVKKILFLVSS